MDRRDLEERLFRLHRGGNAAFPQDPGSAAWLYESLLRERLNVACEDIHDLSLLPDQSPSLQERWLKSLIEPREPGITGDEGG